MRRTLWIAVFVLFAVLVSCAQKSADIVPPSSPRPPPIPLPADGTHSILFQSVHFRIPSGSVLGEVREGRRVIDEMRWSRPRGKTAEFDVGVTDRLRELGFQMKDATDSLFGPMSGARVRFEMAAILHDAELDFQYQRTTNPNRRPEGVGLADVQVEVQLHDMLEKETVYTKEFSGHGEDHGQKPSPIVRAVIDAIAQVASDPEFVKIVSKGEGDPDDPADAANVSRVAACEPRRDRSLPADLPQVMESVVEIEIGRVHGSGVMISPEGYVITAAHIVGSASDVWVRFPVGPQLPATVVRSRPRHDIALLRVEGRGHACSPVRESTSDLEIGNGLFGINLAVGEAGTQTVSRGVVSGYSEWDDRRFIQTDATANPGASGGPLLDDNGEVVGITVNKIVREGFEGIGFAVPSAVALEELGIEFQE
jgi:S1-C subfamily serine protease